MQYRSIPNEILEAGSNLLRPYGVNLSELLKSREATPAAKPLEKTWLSYPEVELCFGVKRWTLWRALRSGKVKASKPSGDQQRGKTLFDRQSIAAWLEKHTV